MSITVTIHISHDRLALVPTLGRLADVTMEVIPHGNTNPGATVFPFRIDYPDPEALEAALDDDPTVEAYDLIDRTGDQSIYYIEHSAETRLISTVVTDVNGFLLHTETTGNGWFVRLLLPDRSALNEIWNYASDQDITLDIIEIYANEDAGGETSYGLTEHQRTALALAYERGYFEEPRDVSLDDLASEMDLSSTAMSGRLRRGIRNLLAATIAEHDHHE
ncbi:helix-turn-helix domain-containing protein [Halomarina salina]|uniref:Helix-turn-helix domain-containing protein n=1 Tax=Halomarina salina TaxID=1872699 RepID=A0ABD5RNK6_9EURY|nr:helix-turn-helix domain-containing protein [Halomarina salina]